MGSFNIYVRFYIESSSSLSNSKKRLEMGWKSVGIERGKSKIVWFNEHEWNQSTHLPKAKSFQIGAYNYPREIRAHTYPRRSHFKSEHTRWNVSTHVPKAKSFRFNQHTATWWNPNTELPKKKSFQIRAHKYQREIGAHTLFLKNAHLFLVGKRNRVL